MPGSLRDTVLKGGAYLAIRQTLGTAIAIVGVLVLTHILGPVQYGLYAAALGILTVAQLVAQLGIGVYLVRSDKPISVRERDTATALSLVLGLIAAALLVGSVPLIERFTRITGFGAIAFATFASLPVTQLAQVPLALLERELDYKRIATIELLAQAAFPLVALPLALAHPTATALVAGWWAQQVVLLVFLHVGARYRPALQWDSQQARDAVHFGVAYTASTWIYQMRRLVNPLIVGRYLGAGAVGIVSVTSQIVTNLAFISVATWRLSTAALARVQNDPVRLARAINEGMTLQVVAIVPFLLLFGIVGPWVVPFIMGPKWLPIMTVYPYLAVVMTVTAMYTLPSSALYVLKQNVSMAKYHAAHTLLLAAVALLLVPTLGLHGYGIAELASMGGFLVLHRETVRHVPGLRYFVIPKDMLSKARGISPAALFGSIFK